MIALPVQLPRFAALVFIAYAVFLVIARWPITRVLTVERRFLLLFFLLELFAAATNTATRLGERSAPTVGTWLAMLTQAFAAAYLHYSIPAEYRRPWHRISHRPHRV